MVIHCGATRRDRTRLTGRLALSPGKCAGMRESKPIVKQADSNVSLTINAFFTAI